MLLFTCIRTVKELSGHDKARFDLFNNRAELDFYAHLLNGPSSKLIISARLVKARLVERLVKEISQAC